MTGTLTGHDLEEGTLPNGWSRERIADVLTELANGKVLNQGKSPQCEKESSSSDEVWGVLKTTAIQPGKFLSVHNKRLPSSREPDESIEVASGDLLLTCAGPRVRCGVPCLVRETRPRLMLSGKMYRFRPNEELIGAEFLEGYLLSPGAQEHIEGMKTGTSDSGLNLTHGRFSELPVPIPPLEEQGRIVEILEDQLSRLDTALHSVHTVREKAAQFRRSLLHAAFTGRLTEEWREAVNV
jgi:type I restriction enzyme, S subunit